MRTDPCQFKAKLDGNIKKTKMALARMAYMQKKGIWKGADAAASEISLEQMERMIEQRGAELRRRIIDQNPKTQRRECDAVC